jgi:hypothetical protein
VTALDHVLFAFNGAAGGARRQTASAMFPAGGAYSKINLRLKLDCPAGGCDHWDRFGSLGVVSSGAVVEIARFITPYAVAAPAWDYDVTDLAPLLRGNLTVQGFIDTWSPQGNPGANGAGWSLTATFTFTGGVPAKNPVAVIPVWSWPPNADPPNSAQYGDPADPIANHLAPQTISLPSGASSYAMRTFITGHGQGNANNCAEFCQATHTVTVGTSPFAHMPWRTCCTPAPACGQQNNPPTPGPGVTPGQQGTYWYTRAGWCPGAAVDAWTQDVTQAVGSGASSKVTYGVDSYVNACRMDAPTCDMSKCPGGTGCNYDGALHTEPFFYVSSLLIAYQ